MEGVEAREVQQLLDEDDHDAAVKRLASELLRHLCFIRLVHRAGVLSARTVEDCRHPISVLLLRLCINVQLAPSYAGPTLASIMPEKLNEVADSVSKLLDRANGSPSDRDGIPDLLKRASDALNFFVMNELTNYGMISGALWRVWDDIWKAEEDMWAAISSTEAEAPRSNSHGKGKLVVSGLEEEQGNIMNRVIDAVHDASSVIGELAPAFEKLSPDDADSIPGVLAALLTRSINILDQINTIERLSCPLREIPKIVRALDSIKDSVVDLQDCQLQLLKGSQET